MDKTRYYYAGGERVRLQPDSRVAVDLARAGPPASPARSWARAYEGEAPLRGEIRLVDRGEIPDDVFAELDAQSAIHPVYTHGDATIVILPEVRVELDDGKLRLSDLVDKYADAARITEGKYGQVTLLPMSGKGEDAMRLANEIYEKMQPKSAQARFLRVTARPKPR